MVADGARFSEGVELVEPFSGDVKLQQAGLLHVGQSHHLLPLSHRLLATFPGKTVSNDILINRFSINV